MNTLIVAATREEIQPFLSKNIDNNVQVETLITGVGMVATSFAMGMCLAKKRFDLIINVGICGCFNRERALGDLVYIDKDCFAELGAEDNDALLSINELGLGDRHVYSYENVMTETFISELDRVQGITVNTVHGNNQHIEALESKIGFKPEVESMEGAACYYACARLGIPSIQVRSISNYVERRDRNNWKIHEAIKNLNCWLLEKFMC